MPEGLKNSQTHKNRTQAGSACWTHVAMPAAGAISAAISLPKPSARLALTCHKGCQRRPHGSGNKVSHATVNVVSLAHVPFPV